jgi:hypothetical protein
MMPRSRAVATMALCGSGLLHLLVVFLLRQPMMWQLLDFVLAGAGLATSSSGGVADGSGWGLLGYTAANGFGAVGLLALGAVVATGRSWGAGAGAVVAALTGLGSLPLVWVAACFALAISGFSDAGPFQLAAIALASLPSGSAAVAALAAAAAMGRCRRDERAWAEECARDSALT